MGTSVVKPNIMARIQHRDHLTELPGCCACCGKSVDEDGFADPQINIEWHGAIQFCSTCVLEMSQLFGYISPEQYESIKNQNKSLTEEVESLRTSVENLERLYDAASAERLASRGVTVNSDFPVVAESESPPAVIDDSGTIEIDFDSTDRLLAEIADDGTAESTESAESGSSEGPDDVSESPNDNDLSALGI